MSFPAQILVATALVSTLVAGASSAPGTVRSLAAGDMAVLARLSPADLLALANQIEVATELQAALDRLGFLPGHGDLAAELEGALAGVRDGAPHLEQPVSAGQIERLLLATRGLADAESRAEAARSELHRALACL